VGTRGVAVVGAGALIAAIGVAAAAPARAGATANSAPGTGASGAPATGASGPSSAGAGARWFPDRPVAWYEHDDGDVPKTPTGDHIPDLQATLAIRDGLANEVDRILSLEGARPALDVNALDEVACSTWFCARNHLDPMTVDEIAAGATDPPPRLPLTVIKGKDLGDSTGFQVLDAGGRKFLLKFDPEGHLGMNSAGEMIGGRVFHAAGYNVPGAHLVELSAADLLVSPRATYKLYKVQKRPLTAAEARRRLARVARLPDGRFRAVAVNWIGGKVIGGFDMQGTRPGDGNDRIPHERRRSLRASRLIFDWLSLFDGGPSNTVDTYVEDQGRHYVRHYFVDFDNAFGSTASGPQGLTNDGEYAPEVGRTFAALLSFGLYRRPFQTRRDEYERMMRDYPAIGYFPAETFDPDAFRTNRKNPAFIRMTDRDAYWGAKVVTSFSNEQIAALVATGGLYEPDASFAERALRVRRDIIGRRYLRPMAAVEAPAMSDDGAAVCFTDLAIARGYAAAAEARYAVTVGDGARRVLARLEQPAAGPRTCLRVGAGGGTDYRIVEIRTRLAGGGGVPAVTHGKAARIHLLYRPDERRFVVVGLDREE
jgi:hypothetical protein